jgi:hypothetical protein
MKLLCRKPVFISFMAVSHHDLATATMNRHIIFHASDEVNIGEIDL